MLDKRQDFRDGARRTGLVIQHHGGFHGLNPAALYSTIKVVIVLYLRIARFRLLEPPFPSPWMIADRSSPSRVRCAASRPGPLRADLGRRAVHEGKGGGGRVDGQKGNLSVIPGVTSRNGKNRTLRPIERRAGPELALFNLLVQPPAMVQNIVGKELDRLGHARVGVPSSGRSCSPKRSRCGDRAWRSPEPSLSGRTL